MNTKQFLELIGGYLTSPEFAMVELISENQLLVRLDDGEVFTVTVKSEDEL